MQAPSKLDNSSFSENRKEGGGSFDFIATFSRGKKTFFAARNGLLNTGEERVISSPGDSLSSA